jgi:hypothetical protein
MSYGCIKHKNGKKFYVTRVQNYVISKVKCLEINKEFYAILIILNVIYHTNLSFVRKTSLFSK